MKTLKFIKSILFLVAAVCLTGFAGASYAHAAGFNPQTGAIVGVTTGTVIAVFAKQSHVVGALGDYTATAITAARLAVEDALAGKMNQALLRQPRTGALNAYLASAPMLVRGGLATLNSLRSGSSHTTSIPVRQELANSVGNARKCAGSGKSTSALVNLSYTTYAMDFKISYHDFEGNEFAMEQEVRQLTMDCFRKLHRELDSVCASHLESNKSALNNGSINTFDAANNKMTVAAADKEQYFASIDAEMEENDFSGPFFNVHSPAQMMRQNLQQYEGSGNQTNLAPQQEGFTHYSSKNVSTETGDESTSYIFEPGIVGLTPPWIKDLNRRGEDIGTDVWTTIPDPFIPGWTWELKMQKGCADNSGTFTGAEADLEWSFVISADFATLKAYTDDTDTYIYKYTQTK